MKTFKEIDLMVGEDDDRGKGAFDFDAMREYGAGNAGMTQYLAQSLQPICNMIGGFLREGRGFAVVAEGDRVEIIGIKATGEIHDDIVKENAV